MYIQYIYVYTYIYIYIYTDIFVYKHIYNGDQTFRKRRYMQQAYIHGMKMVQVPPPLWASGL